MTSFLEVKELIQNRRSIRKYKDIDVSNEDIIDVLDCARYAPSDTNSQTWEFIVIKDREKIKKIEEMTWDALRERAGEAEEKGLEKESKLLLRSFGPYATAFSGAPVLIICLATPYNSKFKEKIFEPIGLVDESVWREEGIKSSCLASQNLMLAAYAKGLGTCPMTGPVLLAQDKIRAYLGIEGEKEINMVIALGYPQETPKRIARKEVSEISIIIE
ncbi:MULTISPECIES: nitroreductase family protein [Neobacillus]|uniref:Nitroreductase family protein n=1 Tax=Neobacillus rhizophilus TaxID=2833579 RepID=A0A942U9M7_9BACI|nr:MULTISPECIES: nitroreductase family protein [Neobacillus]MBS4214069.1 nitroreductase family protein [Neobacillus rhizophilus]